MKIGVCVKAVPEPGTARMDSTSNRLDRSTSLVLNPFDLHAVEEALRLREVVGEGEVVAISLGPDAAWEALLKALAMGADRALLFTDDNAIGSDLVATSRVLATIVAAESFDLVLFGQQSSDADGAVLAAAVADRLRLPLASQASELVVQDATATIRRQTEFGYDKIEVPLPAVVSVSDAINEPRYPALRGMMAAKKKPLEELTASSLGIDPAVLGESGSKTVVLRVADAPRREGGIVVEDDGAAAERILEFLIERKLLP
jgi:electron transfer flavoprotein beta subunit